MNFPPHPFRAVFNDFLSAIMEDQEQPPLRQATASSCSFQKEKGEERVDRCARSRIGPQQIERSLPGHSVQSLICEFTARPLTSAIPLPGWFAAPAYGYETGDEFLLSEHERLRQLFQANNLQFRDRIDKISEEFLGIFEEIILPSGTNLYVCGDIHGNLMALISILRFLQQSDFLDVQYRCVSNFSIVFLGDYVDRGRNNLQVLTLLLALRMENPHSVFLVRGNHESLDGAMHYSFGDPYLTEFFQKNSVLCEQCFQTFPMALCVSSQEKHQKTSEIFQQQYVHFSHGLFSLSVDPSSFLRGENAVYPISRRIFFAPSWKSGERVQIAAVTVLSHLFENEKEANNPLGYLWSDIRESSSFHREGLRYAFSPEAIDLVRKASETAAKKVCLFVRAHQHEFKEHRVNRKPGSRKDAKVVAITLPMNTYPCSGQIVAQGVLFRVASRVRDWRKELCTLSWDRNVDRFIFRENVQSGGAYRQMYF